MNLYYLWILHSVIVLLIQQKDLEGKKEGKKERKMEKKERKGKKEKEGRKEGASQGTGQTHFRIGYKRKIPDLSPLSFQYVEAK